MAVASLAWTAPLSVGLEAVQRSARTNTNLCLWRPPADSNNPCLGPSLPAPPLAPATSAHLSFHPSSTFVFLTSFFLLVSCFSSSLQCTTFSLPLTPSSHRTYLSLISPFLLISSLPLPHPIKTLLLSLHLSIPPHFFHHFLFSPFVPSSSPCLNHLVHSTTSTCFHPFSHSFPFFQQPLLTFSPSTPFVPASSSSFTSPFPPPLPRPSRPSPIHTSPAET